MDFNYCDKEGNQFLPKCESQCIECMRVDLRGEMIEAGNVLKSAGKILKLNQKRLKMIADAQSYMDKGHILDAKKMMAVLSDITERIDNLKSDF